MLIDTLIRFSVQNKFIIGLFVLSLITWGIWALGRLPIDAVPDITNNQVQVITVSPTLAPQEVEQYITVPVELLLANLPGVEEIRSISKFGLSVITIVFREEVPTLDGRQLVNEQLSLANEQIPPGLGQPRMMPITTGLGEIYQYVLLVEPGYEDRYDAMALRSIQDWIVKRYLNGMEGVVEISSFGGFVRQIEVALRSDRLLALDVTIAEVETALRLDNQNVGSAYLEQEGRSFYLRAEGLLQSPEDIGAVLVSDRGGVPILVRDVAVVRDGFPPRYGAMTRNGEGETVGGITLMLKGANSDAVISTVRDKVDQLAEVLPEGVSLHAYLDRSELVKRTTSTVQQNLLEGGLIVIFVLVLLLGNIRAGLIVASVIPLSLLFAFGMMDLFGVSANLMSLGAVDFGLIVDGAVILIEATVHRLQIRFSGQRLDRASMDEAVIEATSKIRKSAAFGEIIILMVYLPLLSLEGVEGKMFVPMAQTVSFAIIGALILSLTYVPMMAALGLSRSPQQRVTGSERLVTWLHRCYEPLLHWALRRKVATLVLAGLALAGSLWVFSRLGGEFIPQLDEGDLAMQMSLPPGSSLSQSVSVATEVERLMLANFPNEVKEIISKIGAAEVPTDPMGVEDADIMVLLHPTDQWQRAKGRPELVEMMERVLTPLEEKGTSFEFTQPIELRFNELLTGSKSDIAIKIFGDDLDTLAALGQQAVSIIKDIPGAADLRLSRTEGFPQLLIAYRRERLAALGLRVVEVNESIEAAYAGVTVGMILEKDRRIDLAIRLHPDDRQQVEGLENLRLRRPDGSSIPLREVADIRYEEGPMLIQRDNTRRQVSIGVNVRERDVEQLVEDIQRRLSEKLPLPDGYAYFYGGEFEQLQSARRRLSITVPLVLFLIFSLLFLTFHSINQALMIFSAIPLAAIGGILSLWLRGMPFSISAGVGFIALFGVAVLNGIVLIAYLNQLKEEGWEEVPARILEATKVRFRPVIMTALVASLGFLPMAISTGAGAEVQRPLATVVIGGLLTATLLTLVVLPVLYSIPAIRFRRRSATNVAAMIVAIFFLFPGAFGQAPQQSLSEEDALMLARQRAPAVRMEQAGLAVIESRKKGLWDPGETHITWQQGQMNTARFDAMLSIDQPLGRPWALPAQRHAWNSSLQTAEARILEAGRYAEEQVALWYEENYFCQHTASLADSMILLYDRLIDIQQARAAAGEDLPFELGLATTARGQWRLQRQEALARVREIQFSLTRWLDLDTLPVLPPAPSQPRRLLYSQAERLQSWEQHPTARRLYLERVEQEAAVQTQRMQATPALQTGYFGQTLDGFRGFQGFHLGINIPLWWPAQSAKVQVQTALTHEQLLQSDLAAQAHEELVRRYWETYEYRRSALAFYEEEALSQAERIAQVSEQRYRNGEMSFQQVLYFLTQTASWKEAQLLARYQLHVSIISLSYLTQ